MPQLALFDAACSAGDRVSVIDDAGDSTYRQLLDRAGRVAERLAGLGDDLDEQRIALLAEPGRGYVAAQWGIWQAGGVCVPLGLMHPRPELEYVIDDADVAAVIAAPQLAERVREVAAARSLPLIETDAFAGHTARTELPNLGAGRRAMIVYTSGSTGGPKGVVSTHGNILAQVDSLVQAWEWRAEDRILSVLPLHHVHGIINVVSCAMRVGAVCEFLRDPDPAQIWERFASGDLTLFMAVPTIYARLIRTFEEAPPEKRQRWSTGARQLRLMVSGSAALPVPTLEKWEAITGQRLLERYGMTELGMALSNPLHGSRRAGCVGSPLPGVEVRLAAEDGQPCPPGTAGEIEVRGPTVFAEYWRRPEATREAFRDGWFRTGDVAVEDDGAYRILGRSSVDIIKTGGYKVSALEIEDHLRGHPAISDCAVVGIPDAEWGERVAAWAVLRPGTTLDLDALRSWAKQRMAHYKVPTCLHSGEELPRNAMGKVQKPKVRAFFENQ